MLLTATIWCELRGEHLLLTEVVEALTEKELEYKKSLRISYLKLIYKNRILNIC